MVHDNIRRLPSLSLGEAMHLFGLTARALRFYEERGLITARRNRANNRCYDETARWRLGWISALRAAGLALRDIAEVLQAQERNGRGQECAILKLHARRAEVQLELAKIDLAVTRLGGLEPTLAVVRGQSRA